MTDAATPARPNPYIGPRSFQAGEALYGRDRELQDLLGLLIAERIVLLHSPSGAGKTSLVQAALIPRLVEQDFDVLPIIRVSLEPPASVDLSVASSSAASAPLPTPSSQPPAPNRYVLSALISLEEGLPAERQTALANLATMSLADYLDRRPPAEGAFGQVLIFDQFEEILTVDPTDVAAKAEFFAQVGAALRDRQRWALFSMREDYVAALDPYLRPVPTRLNTTYRLDLLSAAGARQAIQQPARRLGVEFDGAAAAQLADDLRRVLVQRADGSAEQQLGPSVEPVQLQVVCYRLWDQLAPGARQIGAGDLVAVGDVNTALADYYSDRVAAAARETGVSERDIRTWFDRQLITAQGLRGQVLQTAERSAGLDNRAIWALIDAYLARAEQRRGATWFELAHDRLIEPVRANNAAWFAANLSPLQIQADLWDRQSRPNGMLLRDAALESAERWAAANPGALIGAERDFLELSRQARAQAIRERRTNLVIRGLFVAALVVAAVALFFYVRSIQEAARASTEADNARAAEAAAVQNANAASTAQAVAQTQEAAAVEQRATAVASEQRANAERANAEREQRVGRARELAAAAVSSLSSDPQLSLMLATNAISATQGVTDTGAPTTPLLQSTAAKASQQLIIANAVEALQQAVQATRARTILSGHAGGIQRVAYRPDGAQLATGSNDGTVKLWDAASGQLQSTIALPSGADVLALEYDRQNGGRLAIAGANDDGGFAGVWDTSTGQPAVELTGHEDTVTDIAFSPDGARLATTSADGTARVWDATSGDQLLELPATLDPEGQPIERSAVAWSPDGRRLAVAAAAAAGLYDATSGRVQAELRGHTSAIEDITFDVAGNLIATAGDDETARVWDARSGAPLLVLRGHASNVYAVAFSPSATGIYLATASADGTAKIWNAARDSGKELLTLAGHSAGIAGLAFSPDARFLATAGLSPDNTARIWSLGLLHSDRVSSVAISPDGKTLASASLDGAHLWEAATGQEVRLLRGADRSGVAVVAFSPDGALLASGGYGGAVELWDTSTGQRARALPGPRDAIAQVVFSRDGALLAAASDDGTAFVWRAASGERVREIRVGAGPEMDVSGVAFSPDGGRMATASSLGPLQLWDVAGGGDQAARTIETGRQLNALAWSPDGARLLSGDEDGNAVLWDARSGTAVFTVTHGLAINGVAFSPDGTLLATASSDKTVVIWDAGSGKALLTLTHPSSVTAVAFSLAGAQLATAGADAAVRLFPLNLDDLLAEAARRTIRAPSPAECARFQLGAPCPAAK
jgi:WD40 repeat protein